MKKKQESNVELQCSSSALHAAIVLAMRGQSKRSVLPIHEYLLVQATAGGQVTVSGTNGQMIVRGHAEAAVMQEGVFYLSAKEVSETLERLPDQVIEVEASSEKGWVQITSAIGRYKSSALSATEFPPVPRLLYSPSEYRGEDALTMSSKVLSRALGFASLTVSQDELRPALTAILLKGSAEGYVFASTNGFFLTHYVAPLDDSERPLSKDVLLPSSAANALLALLGQEQGYMGIKIRLFEDEGGNHLSFDAPSWDLEVDVPRERFPEYSMLISPRDYADASKITFDCADMIAALKVSSKYSDPDHSNQVAFKAAGGKLALTAQNYTFERRADQVLSCDIENSVETDWFSLNSSALLRLVKANKDQERMCFKVRKEPRKPVLLFPEDSVEGHHIHALMPIANPS